MFSLLKLHLHVCLCANQIASFSSKVPQVATSNVFDLYNGLGMSTLVSNFTLPSEKCDL